MARTQTMVQLTDEIVRLLDQRAQRDGISRSQLIRDAVDDYLASDLSAEIDRRMIEAYTVHPQGDECDRDEWGDVGSLLTGLTGEQQRALTEEERAEGHESW